MSYTEEDLQRDLMWDYISEELYPDHKEQAIEEFIEQRLQSYYLENPTILHKSLSMHEEGKSLINHSPSAALIFFTTTIELLLKVALLKPVVYGMVHNETMANVIMSHALGQTGFDRYKKLLSNIFLELAGIDISLIQRVDSNKPLLQEASEIQKIRNGIIHRGEKSTEEQAQQALAIVENIYSLVVMVLITNIGLSVNNDNNIVRK